MTLLKCVHVCICTLFFLILNQLLLYVVLYVLSHYDTRNMYDIPNINKKEIAYRLKRRKHKMFKTNKPSQ